MGYGCVRHTRDALEFVTDDIDVQRSEDVDVVHWVPAESSIETRLRTVEGDVSGYAEPGVADYDADEMLQFERVGFARVDRHDEDETVAYFAHR